jgi:hypothetical protein
MIRFNKLVSSAPFLALIVISLIDVARAGCSDTKAAGIAVDKDSGAYEGFFYPTVSDEGISGESQRIFENTVKDLQVTYNAILMRQVFLLDRKYQATDGEGDAFGNELDIEEEYGDEADDFKNTCEELWACS